MSENNKPYLFISPQREIDAAKSSDFTLGIPIRVNTAVPTDELWWGEQLPTEMEISGGEVRTISRIRIIHKLKLGQ